MSKCDLSIEFNRADRKYQCGEKITGKVAVQVNKNVNCRALVLCGKYSTHGKGNKDSEEYQETTLTSGQLRAGQIYEFPFEIIAPEYPLTYRGNYLNIDHYIRLRVDIPWAFDAKLEEEFLLSPSDEHIYSAHLPSLQESHHDTQSAKVVMSVFGGIFLLVGLIMIPFTCGFSLIFMFVGAGMVGMNIRSVLAERKLGEVIVNGLPTRAFGGSEIPVQIAFTPNKSTRINKVELTLSADEIAVSGSGSNRTTHTHNLVKQTVLANIPDEAATGNQVRIDAVIEIPQTHAYSVKFSDNRIEWKVGIHIDIPKWPDWVKDYIIQVVPSGDTAKFDADMPMHESFPDKTDSAIGKLIDRSVDKTTAAPLPPVSIKDSFVEQPVVPSNTTFRSDLTSVTRQLTEFDRFSDDAANLVSSIASDLFKVELVVDRTYETRGVYDDKRYEDGFTIKGTLSGTDTDVIIELPVEYNSDVGHLGHGNIWSGTGVIINWDGLYEQLQMMGI